MTRAQQIVKSHEHLRLARVAAGVDFSAPGIAAVDWLRHHFAGDDPCVIVHALDVPRPPRFLRDALPAPAELVQNAREGATARLEALRTSRDWGEVTLDVRDGRPEEVLGEAARAFEADLLVVGEHARPRASWASPGSTADAIVRGSSVPVLVVRNPADHPPRRLLVAVDDSQYASLALAWARLLSDRFDADVTICHVFRPVYIALAKSVSGMAASAGLEQKQLDQAANWLAGLAHDAGFGDDADLRIEKGDPASSIVAAQRGGNYDLAIVGSRGAGGAGRLLLGSVANAVLRGASCSVLVVPDRGREP